MTKRKILLKYAVAFFLLSFSKELFAEENGQLININQNYKIAFTDLGNSTLNQGDIVKISLNQDEFVYMQVLESSAILSKLGMSKAQGFQTDLNDFGRLTVGDTVVKVSAIQDQTENPAEAIAVPKDTEVPSLQLQIHNLEQDLADAKEQVRLLQESNEKSKETLNELIAEAQVKKTETPPQDQTDGPKEVLKQLKTYLDNMSKIVNEND